MATEFSLQILYGQLAVYRPDKPQLNLWNDSHVAQGFAWREGNVSFGIPDHDGPSLVEIDFSGERRKAAPECLRAVAVPLRVAAHGAVLATVMDEYQLAMKPGSYRVLFELLPGITRDEIDYAFRVRLTFTPDDAASFEILKGDHELTAKEVLTKEAEPAP
jgi:hypothetical protein